MSADFQSSGQDPFSRSKFRRRRIIVRFVSFNFLSIRLWILSGPMALLLGILITSDNSSKVNGAFSGFLTSRSASSITSVKAGGVGSFVRFGSVDWDVK